MHVAFDVDGTLDASTPIMASMMSALRTAGHQISILTGASDPVPNKENVTTKINYLRSLGMDTYWSHFVVIGDPPHLTKAKWVKDNNVDMLFDNSMQNARLCSQHCLVMLPWNTKQD